MSVQDWMNSPDIKVDYEHSDPRLTPEPVIPDGDDPVQVVGQTATNPHHRNVKNIIPRRFACKADATGTLTEIAALEWYHDQLDYNDGLTIRYEPISFQMPSGRYTPDLYAFVDGIHTMFEVKPAGWEEFQKNQNASKKSLREFHHFWGWMFRIGYMVKNRAKDVRTGAPLFTITYLEDSNE